MNTTDIRQLHIRQLQKLYRTKKKEIVRRLKEFDSRMKEEDDAAVFSELVFCLLTPQSKAKCCWDAVETLNRKKILVAGNEDEIKVNLRGVRFHNKKAAYIVKARKLFKKSGAAPLKTSLGQFSDVHECRDWLVKNIKGLGYKEASHFLRNIGSGDGIAILDRHILRNLVFFGVIEDIPSSLSRETYSGIEKKMAGFARSIRIPLAHLDLLLWYKETGEIFK